MFDFELTHHAPVRIVRTRKIANLPSRGAEGTASASGSGTAPG
jgi:hypothetical protein